MPETAALPVPAAPAHPKYPDPVPHNILHNPANSELAVQQALQNIQDSTTTIVSTSWYILFSVAYYCN